MKLSRGNEACKEVGIPRCQVAEHYWDPVGRAIVIYGHRFDRLIQASQREV